MKKRKPANFAYDLTGLAVEVTGDDLYLINGGAEVENSHQGVANAQVGDTITRSNGQVVVLKQYDIDLAQDQLGISGPTTDAASQTPTPNVTMGGERGNIPNQSSTTQFCNMNYVPTLSKKEISYILKHNRGVYRNKMELIQEWESAKSEEGGIFATFNSVDSAALYWTKTYGDDSVVNGTELASFIFACDVLNHGATEIKYFYNKPLKGTVIYNENNKPTMRKSWFNELSGLSAEDCEENNVRIVSGIHSHGDGDPYFDFKNPSSVDKDGVDKNIDKYESYIGKEYVASADGCLKIFNKDGLIGKGIISSELFRDLRQDFNDFSLENLPERLAFDFYKKMNYHPDTFMAYGTYPINN